MYRNIFCLSFISIRRGVGETLAFNLSQEQKKVLVPLLIPYNLNPASMTNLRKPASKTKSVYWQGNKYDFVLDLAKGIGQGMKFVR
jgi:hypothetical protein